MSGHAAIGLMESFGRAVVSRLMTHMAERHFQVSLDVFIGGTEQIVGQLAARKLDLAICYAVPRQPDIQFLARVPSNPGIVVARSHPLANRKSIRLADCAQHSFVLPDASLTSRGILEKALRRAGLHPAATVTTNSIEVMKALVREHRQIALLALPDIHSDLVDGEFVHIPFADRHVRGIQPVADRPPARPPVAGGGDGGGSSEGAATATARQIAPSSKRRRRVRKVMLLVLPWPGVTCDGPFKGPIRRNWGTA